MVEVTIPKNPVGNDKKSPNGKKTKTAERKPRHTATTPNICIFLFMLQNYHFFGSDDSSVLN